MPAFPSWTSFASPLAKGPRPLICLRAPPGFLALAASGHPSLQSPRAGRGHPRKLPLGQGLDPEGLRGPFQPYWSMIGVIRLDYGGEMIGCGQEVPSCLFPPPQSHAGHRSTSTSTSRFWCPRGWRPCRMPPPSEKPGQAKGTGTPTEAEDEGRQRLWVHLEVDNFPSPCLVRNTDFGSRPPSRAKHKTK